MTQFAVARTFVAETKFESTMVLGVFPTLDQAKAYVNGLVSEMRDELDWQDEPNEWTEDRGQWTTTDFPVDTETYHSFTVGPV